MAPRMGMDPGPHWWEASALTTARTLHPVPIFWLAEFCFSVSQASCRQALTNLKGITCASINQLRPGHIPSI